MKGWQENSCSSMATQRYKVSRRDDFDAALAALVPDAHSRTDIMEAVTFALEHNPDAGKFVSYAAPVRIPIRAFHVAPWHHSPPLIIYYCHYESNVQIMSVRETKSPDSE